MKTAVIYWSKTGFVKKYADWIAEELSADLILGKKAKLENLNEYDALILGGSLYAVGITGLDFIKKVIANLNNKKIAVFATGASSAREDIIAEVKNNNFSEAEQEYFEFFYLRGGFDFNKLSLKDKILMLMMKWKLKRKAVSELDEEEKGLLDAFETPVDFTDKNNIKDLIAYIKN